MQARIIGNTGIHASVLGIGCMRLPVIDQDSSKIDENKAIELIRYAIDGGVNYVDTAYPYHGGHSESIVGKALQDGYREKVHLVTKAPTWLLETETDFDRYLDEQLEKLQTETLDIYLLHALSKSRWDKLLEINIFEAIERAKASGKIKNIGFSFHDTLDVFKEIVDAYDWDVCMIQFNYMDVEDQAGEAGLLYAESKDIPVIVMEPLKGGMIATPPDSISKIFKESGSDQNRSPVEWALRFVANYKNVKVVLSGMSNLDQLKENIDIADRLQAESLTADELKVIAKVRDAYQARVKVPCTQCGYCMPCPHGVDIPRAFTLYNRASIFDAHDQIKGQYNSAKDVLASKCIACGACEPQCPQHIEIISRLKEVVTAFES
ncbi:aldo/keto reductase [Fusibacter tunisiensis]|uniref:Aldo/keto reductase-like oxidoreductase n=1 Tax=Fusibacter tunisiensis TaxID=1008308 RepID=A0ABS2MR65_9FIRM|nr:aldo/keto reductase [Fusibacter tunisiensis]MBM7561884.1 putative aldo/keto reductase-like oxidoreductase [Fusibacter tunisiensis]